MLQYCKFLPCRIIQKLKGWHEGSLEAHNKEKAIDNVSKLRHTDHDLAKITKTDFKATKKFASQSNDDHQEEDDSEEEEEESEEEEDKESTQKNKYSKQAQLAREVEEEIIYGELALKLLMLIWQVNNCTVTL